MAQIFPPRAASSTRTVQRYRATFGEREYTYVLRYVQRVDRWYFDLYAADGTVLLTGARVALRQPLTSDFRDDNTDVWPGGLLVPLAIDGSTDEPGLLDLGDRVLLFWFDDSELPVLSSSLDITVAEVV